MFPDSLLTPDERSPSAPPEVAFSRVYEQPTLDAAVREIVAAYDFSRHPYFVWLDAPETTLEAMRRSQVGFRFAVEGFSQALAAVLARVPIMEARAALAANVAEEHGCCGRPSHKATFFEYLATLGATDAELARECPIAVRAFNASMLGYCLTNGAEPGAAATGIVERLYVDISARLVATIRRREWADLSRQTHYAVHEKLDVEHARELFEIAAPGWGEPRLRAQIAMGLLLGAHYFWSLYDGLLPR